MTRDTDTDTDTERRFYMFRMKCVKSKSTYFIVGNVYYVKAGYLYSEKGIYTPRRFESITEVNEFFDGIVEFELY